jgi:GWxTD domain-containing protein
MGIKNLTTCVAILLTAGLVAAEPPADWKDYFDGPERFLLTKKEKKEWKKIKSEGEAERFIELFWAKRDPDLLTPLNEFLQDFELRVEAADEAFGSDEDRGAMSDRGRTLILLGRPKQRVEQTPEAQTGVGGDFEGFGSADPGDINPVPSGGGGANSLVGPTGPPGAQVPSSSQVEAQRERGTIEMWIYDPQTLPVSVPQRALLVVFRETRLGKGNFVIVKDLARNTVAQRVLAAAPDTLLRHPDLTEVPRYGLIQGTQPASAEQLDWFAAERPWPDDAAVVVTEGLVTGPRHFIWAHLQLPPGAPEQALAVGRLVNAQSGLEVGSFQLEVEGLEFGGGRGYQVSVPVGKGSWSLDLALADQTGALAVTAVDLETTEVPLDATVFSPFYWGADVLESEEPKLSDPFNVGGWRIVPRASGSYDMSEDLTYMAYILQPVVRPGQEPDFTLTVSLYRGSRRLVASQPQKIQLSQVAPDMWMYGSGIDLGRLKRPGNYKIEVELTQTSDGSKNVVEIPLVIERESSD